MWVTKLLISPVKKRIFCPKTTKFGPKLAFLVNLGKAMQAYSVPCWWAGWWLWCAGCISQDTYLLYSLQFLENVNLFSELLTGKDDEGEGRVSQKGDQRDGYVQVSLGNSLFIVIPAHSLQSIKAYKSFYYVNVR